jgi:hypothetical protein
MDWEVTKDFRKNRDGDQTTMSLKNSDKSSFGEMIVDIEDEPKDKKLTSSMITRSKQNSLKKFPLQISPLQISPLRISPYNF